MHLSRGDSFSSAASGSSSDYDYQPWSGEFSKAIKIPIPKRVKSAAGKADRVAAKFTDTLLDTNKPRPSLKNSNAHKKAEAARKAKWQAKRKSWRKKNPYKPLNYSGALEDVQSTPSLLRNNASEANANRLKSAIEPENRATIATGAATVGAGVGGTIMAGRTARRVASGFGRKARNAARPDKRPKSKLGISREAKIAAGGAGALGGGAYLASRIADSKKKPKVDYSSSSTNSY